MVALSERFDELLAVQVGLLDQGRAAIRTSDMTRTHREGRLYSGFIREVV
jgi:hypothetical protein